MIRWLLAGSIVVLLSGCTVVGADGQPVAKFDHADDVSAYYRGVYDACMVDRLVDYSIAAPGAPLSPPALVNMIMACRGMRDAAKRRDLYGSGGLPGWDGNHKPPVLTPGNDDNI